MDVDTSYRTKYYCHTLKICRDSHILHGREQICIQYLYTVQNAISNHTFCILYVSIAVLKLRGVGRGLLKNHAVCEI